MKEKPSWYVMLEHAASSTFTQGLALAVALFDIYSINISGTHCYGKFSNTIEDSQ